ncbi:uncharacterized protein [Drosophila virilis]|uniref:Uncharacterized protein n=1 Tax=Drosophila virilis TaxID=7244 RepID=B4LWQ2_DROVI|nr:uncharacterized protein LOC6630409 [Drosophila virilis]EDW67717.1 uncharacterized protein Dvir_GJ24308 [Drosophila virilis]
MSSHSYRTTTVEYYEYLMPESREYDFESIHWPLHAAISDSYVTRPLCSFNYLTSLQDHLAMAGDNNQHSELIYDTVQCPQRQTIYEFSEQEEPHSTYASPNQAHEDQAADMAKEHERETGDGDASASETHTEEKQRGKKNIYRTKQGYLVEEPTSESEEDQEGTT